ncbi:hypothetical protein PVK06_005302 [Gossypium arboreum]|uniref:Reverse transcriptase zinc-binding domain-containing protein n=1 Tax=Gossypium arboreum TaxID=29729 RepID=A0ABR0QV94_GOSAR|nr:hypothetical protein PVK06_005302 [Gossypium arboreum]
MEAWREATSRGANLFKDILREYRSCSSQRVNFDKSIIFFSENTPEEDRRLVVNLLEVRSSNELERNLGLPNMVGKRKKEYFQILKDRLEKQIDNWSNRKGNKIPIWDDHWIQGIDTIEGHNRSDNTKLKLVSDLIDNPNKKWRMDLINNTFQVEIAQKIMQIPFAETDHEDIQVWKGELFGEYSIRSAYKLLQDANPDPSSYLIQAEIKECYRKLWNLQLPSKISIIIWRISWNYIPTLVNLRYRRVITNARCPRCCSWEEDRHHIFRQCPITIEVWQILNLSWVTNNMSQNIWQWLTWVFKRGTNEQC